jgi:hypothetical protein
MTEPTLPDPGLMTNRELADIELDELACESVLVYRDWFCRIIDECARRRQAINERAAVGYDR